ncbi:Uncharacterised protein [Mycobacteroides abscessus subsp. abscessus]|nr:Uncharacterised protein [Mycobacteroides abscessus subsp. abscessus]
MSQKTFDNKKPMGFLRSVINYAITPKLTYAGKPVKSQKEKQTAAVTYVWRYHNEISD